MRRTAEEAERTRQDLLKAALTVFSQQGYSAARLEDIAQAAGVTRGAIYHHFGSKAELFSSLVEQAAETGSRAVDQAIQAGGSFLQIARRVLVYTLRLLEEDPAFRDTMALQIFHSYEAAELAPLRQAQIDQGLQQLAQIEGFFRMGQSQGALHPELDPSVAARAFLAYQNGLVLLWLSAPGSINLEAHADGLADVLVRGIQA